MEYELVKDPWSMQHTIERPYLRRERLEREGEAAFLLNTPMPRYLSFAGSKPNKWGHLRSYRVQIVSFAGEHLPPSSPMERSISWGRWVLGRVWLSHPCPPAATMSPAAPAPQQACVGLQGRVKQPTCVFFWL